MGFLSRIIRCFRCEVANNESCTPNQQKHKVLLANDVPFLSSPSSKECAHAISSALSSPNCVSDDEDPRISQLLYDLHYGVDTNDEDPRTSEQLYDLHNGVDTRPHAFSPPAMELQECWKYYSGTSDALLPNELSSHSSVLSHDDYNPQQFVATLSNGEGGNDDERAKRWGEIVAYVIKNEVVEERWIKHYSSCQRILIVGDGDFSFSDSLAKAFGYAFSMIATSLDSREFLRLNYHRAISNIQDLEMRGCRVMHEMDCTKMAKNAELEGLAFDRIVYNFPFAGFFKNKSREAQLRLHRRLVSQFMENAKKMISKQGEIHITHKSNGFHREWNLEHLAVVQGLRIMDSVHFNYLEYPGYRTKTGFGGDFNFNCNPSKTYIFGLRNY